MTIIIGIIVENVTDNPRIRTYTDKIPVHSQKKYTVGLGWWVGCLCSSDVTDPWFEGIDPSLAKVEGRIARRVQC